MIKIESLTKEFGTNKVLDGLSVEFNSGETTVVLGRSGCGKSVLLKLILRLLPFDSGRVYIDDVDTTDYSERKMMKIRKKMGMLFQGSALFDSMNVFDNIAYTLREHTSLSESEIKARVREKLSFVEMDNTEKLMPSELSGGMQKRIALARALANNPDYIFFDEPTTGLDPITSHTINELIKRVHDQTDSTVIVVTHDLESAAFVAQKVILLNDGKVHFEDTYEAFRNSDDGFVKQFRSGGKVIETYERKY